MLLVTLLLGGVLSYYFFKNKKVKLPNSGSGIPQGWTPEPTAQQLNGLMSGIDWGNTHEDDIYQIVMALTPDQLAAVYNSYNTLFRADLLTDLNEEIGDETMITAIRNKFSGII